MYSLLIAAGIGLVLGFLAGFFINVGFGIFIGIIALIAGFVFFNNYFSKKVVVDNQLSRRLQAAAMTQNPELQRQTYDQIIEELKEGYKYNKYAFFVKARIDTQIGVILYSQRKFGEAYKYLVNSNPRMMIGYLLMIVGHIKNKKTETLERDIELLIRFNKKDPFVYSAIAYLYQEELNEPQKAMDTLSRALKVMPDNPKIQEHLNALQNNREFNMEKYGEQWYQLLLDKKGISRLQNKMIRNQQKSMNVRQRVR